MCRGDVLKPFGMLILFVATLGLVGIACSSSSTTGVSRTEVKPTPELTWDQWYEKAVEIPYNDLFRYAEDHEGKIVFYQGRVIQSLENDGNFQLRVNVTKNSYGWEDTVFLRYRDAPVRVLEDDVIAFVGRMNGTITYEAVMGNSITIPDITVRKLLVKDENSKDTPSFDW